MTACRAERLDSGTRAQRVPGHYIVWVRSLLQTLLLLPTVRWFCRPLVIKGARSLDTGPFVFIANHSSHADTALLLQALPRYLRRRCSPAAAEDYFFGNKVRGFVVRLLTGAFPFPRKGHTGVARAAQLLERGDSVLLFPEGTRSTDGALQQFRAGIGALACRGAAIVPVGISGAREVLAKGRHVPRQHPVAVVFGEPVRLADCGDPDAATVLLQERVSELRAEADALRHAPRRTWFQNLGAFARSRAGLAIVFAWGVAEALIWPVVPDFAVAALAVAAPARWASLSAVAVAGSLVGGMVAHAVGGLEVGASLLDHAPLVTEGMTAQAYRWLVDEGAAGLLQQPLSGIPYKVFALQAHDAGLSLAGYTAYSALARGTRIVAVGLTFAAFGKLTQRWMPSLYGAFLILYCCAFFTGLAKAVQAWS